MKKKTETERFGYMYDIVWRATHRQLKLNDLTIQFYLNDKSDILRVGRNYAVLNNQSVENTD